MAISCHLFNHNKGLSCKHRFECGDKDKDWVAKFPYRESYVCMFRTRTSDERHACVFRTGASDERYVIVIGSTPVVLDGYVICIMGCVSAWGRSHIANDGDNQ